MKLTFAFTFFLTFALNATTIYSQGIKIDTDVEQTTLKDLFEQIKAQSEYRFLYNNDLVNDEQKVDINFEEGTIEEVLTSSLKKLNLSYRIFDKQIMVYPTPLQQKELQQKHVVKGIVTDASGAPLPGVTVVVVGSSRGVITDVDGNFEIDIDPAGQLLFSFIGMSDQQIEVSNRTVINVILQEKSEELEDVTVVAFAKQKKESVLASITTIDAGDLKVPSSNLTTAFAGRVSGLISYQRSGEPGQDDASFFVRGVTSFTYARGPLILIDGVEMSSSDLARIQPDDIASFSIMKDAAATALYGARGANGVIMVTTKEGKEGKAQISFRYETSFSMPTQEVDLADPLTYMRLNNEAVLTRNPLSPIPYSMEKIESTERGANQLVYPATDWYNTLFKNYTINHRANFNVSGGGKIARYYIAATYNQDYGILKVDKQNNFNNNIDLKRYLLRSNVNINITPTTEAVVRLHGTFDDYTGPIDGGSDLYQKVMRTDPVLFPAYYPHTEETSHIKHILFGNYDQGQYINPYADMVKGYKDYTKSLFLAQFEVKQKLDFITQGLNIRGLFSTNRYSFFDVSRYYNPFYYNITGYDKYEDTYQLYSLNPESGTDYLTYNEGDKNITTTTYSEVAINYDRTFNDKHSISGLLVSTMRNYLEANAGSLALSLPARNMGVSGRFTYSYDSRYFTEFNFGYNGSERFAKKERFGFFPSMGLAWIASNEKFWTDGLKRIVSNFKLKGTYGLVGNDAIGDKDDRFFYLSEVNMNSGNRNFVFGEDLQYYSNGVEISRYSNDLITWETARKLNLGAEIGLFEKMDIIVDVYREHRSNILMNRSSIPTTMGLNATPQANIGEAIGRGIDFSLDYNQAFDNGWWLTGRVNFTYAKAEYKVYEEVDNTLTPWLSHIGRPVTQQWGYVAERLFVDEYEVENSPTQTFGEYMGGDIKYRDINNDGIISSLDRVPIGYPTEPEIIYGFGFSSGYKGFDFSCFFQGLAHESFWIDATNTSPFIDTDGNGSVVSKNSLLQVYADDYWSTSNRNIYALWPRLSDHIIQNNMQRNTWFMRDGSFLRLKSMEFGYTIPQRILDRYMIRNLRFYVSGTNLLTFSKFDLWDPEMGGNGLGYPIQKVFNLGVQLSF
ncbi:TonB-dependent receptor [Draconibacterium mangrovi]|uniref:TonB-dependent receptor n=1 Tax=Draconibacterium mangrovi TaxID=2697469 RepID=UPI0019538FB3|nr:TonB-dependent receptor [Draconibacterium mangrovi]